MNYYLHSSHTASVFIVQGETFDKSEPGNPALEKLLSQESVDILPYFGWTRSETPSDEQIQQKVRFSHYYTYQLTVYNCIYMV